MSRRKQPKPQHVLSDHYLPLKDCKEDVYLETPISIDSYLCVCRKCCAEFSDPSCLERHQIECSPNQLVMIVNENEDVFSYAEMLPSASSSPKTPVEYSEKVYTSETEDFSDPTDNNIEDIMNRSAEENLSSNNTCPNGNCNDADSESHVLCASVQTSLPQPGNQSEQGKLSWLSSDVIIENLEGTKVAVAQFSKQFHSDVTSISNSKIDVSSLVEHLLALQLQQIQQLQLIDEIRHKILLFDSKRLELSDSSLRCSWDSLLSKHADERITFSSNLAQQLAKAPDTAQSLTCQPASIVHLKQSSAKLQFLPSELGCETELCSWEPLNVVGKPKTLEVIENDPEKQSIESGETHTKTFFSSQRNMTSLAFSIGGLKDGSSNPYVAQPLPASHKGSRSFGAVKVEVNGSASLPKQKKLKTTHILNKNTCSSQILFKHKCRFCGKVFGSDSALQIHLRSHTGERPYKCNICGSRFSTRGNLKVHFQRHKDRYPYIQMNPYPVPEHLDNLQTSNGIPLGMAMPRLKPLPGWLGSRLNLASSDTSGLKVSSTSMTRHVKKEKQNASPPNPSSPGVHSLDVTEKLFISTDYSGAGKGNVLAVKSEDVISSLKPYLKMTLQPEGSSPLPDEIPPIEMHLNNSGFSPIEETLPLQTSETSKLQHLVENIHIEANDPNECVLCHHTLSCQCTLKMHSHTHTGERHHRCKECGWTFSAKGNLKMHNAVDRTVPPKSARHSCYICNQMFTSAVVLQQHICMHMAGDIPNVQLSRQSFGKPMDEGLRDSNTWNSLYTFSGDNKDFYGNHIVNMSEYDCLSTSSSTNIGAGSINALINNYHFDGTGDEPFSCLKTYRNEGLHKEKNQEYNSLFLEKNQRGDKICVIKNPKMDTFNSGGIISIPTLLSSSIKFASSNHKLHNPLKDTTYNIGERLLFKNIVCDMCGKTFACQSALNIHYRSHTKERPFICTECNRGFSTKGNLKQHMLTHQMRDLPPQLFEPSNPLSNSKPPAFPGMTQKIKTEHTGFLSASHEEVGGCVGSLITPSGPVSAVPVPPQRRMAKQHYCHTCGKVFSSSSALQIHERTHTGEKPFACTVCRRAFTTKGNLKVHMGTHMWNSGPIRRGRRLFADGIEPRVRTVAAAEGDSVYQWSHHAAPFSRGSSTKDTTVIQNGSANIVWDKQRQADQKCLLEIYESSNIDQKDPFCFTQPIKDRKEMVAN